MNVHNWVTIPITSDELYALAKDLGPTRILRRGNGAFTCCPAPGHGDDGLDENPSLWLGIAPSGKTLAISCKAGCDRNVVAAALIPRLKQLKGQDINATYVEESKWEPVDYAPVGTEVPTNIISREWRISPKYIWAYRNPSGRASHVVYRYEKDGKKLFEDMVWCRNSKTKEEGWRIGWYPNVFNLLHA